MKEFIIPFFGLKEGKHEFKFIIGQSFFEAFENSLLDDADVTVKLNLEKLSTMLILNFKAKGTTRVSCDRCGDDFDLPINTSHKLIVKFGEEAFEQTDDIVVLHHDAHDFDVSQEIYEMLVLSLPNKRVHARKSDCNQEAIELLKSFKSNEEENTDPRWDALKKLK